MVGYYRTTGEFFLVSANSSTILLYNTRLGRAGGKENALFLQAVSTSFHNETISIREGPLADFTINYRMLQKRIISEATEEKKKMWWSQEEKRLCASPCLWEHFSPSASVMQPMTGAPQTQGVLLYPIPWWNKGTGTRWCGRSEGHRESQQRHKAKACTSLGNLSLRGD